MGKPSASVYQPQQHWKTRGVVNNPGMELRSGDNISVRTLILLKTFQTCSLLVKWLTKLAGSDTSRPKNAQCVDNVVTLLKSLPPTSRRLAAGL